MDTSAEPSDSGRRDPDCLFCRIVAGEIPGDIVRQNDRAVAFRDISPAAPSHVLVVPRAHYPDLAALVSADPELAGQLASEAVAVAHEEGLDDGGYRIVVNTGAGAGQTVFHVHAHVLGGRAFAWPPG
jgi:histidine triad (HIT) family protein